MEEFPECEPFALSAISLPLRKTGSPPASQLFPTLKSGIPTEGGTTHATAQFTEDSFKLPSDAKRRIQNFLSFFRLKPINPASVTIYQPRLNKMNPSKSSKLPTTAAKKEEETNSYGTTHKTKCCFHPETEPHWHLWVASRWTYWGESVEEDEKGRKQLELEITKIEMECFLHCKVGFSTTSQQRLLIGIESFARSSSSRKWSATWNKPVICRIPKTSQVYYSTRSFLYRFPLLGIINIVPTSSDYFSGLLWFLDSVTRHSSFPFVPRRTLLTTSKFPLFPGRSISLVPVR